MIKLMVLPHYACTQLWVSKSYRPPSYGWSIYKSIDGMNGALISNEEPNILEVKMFSRLLLAIAVLICLCTLGSTRSSSTTGSVSRSSTSPSRQFDDDDSLGLILLLLLVLPILGLPFLLIIGAALAFGFNNNNSQVSTGLSGFSNLIPQISLTVSTASGRRRKRSLNTSAPSIHGIEEKLRRLEDNRHHRIFRTLK